MQIQIRRTLAILALSIISYNGYTQTGFFPGYIVKDSNDTIRCLIRERRITTSTESIVTKPEQSGREQIFKLSDISAFMVNGNHYVSAKNIGFSKDHFLKLLFRGRVKLFSYQDKGDEYFVMEKENTWTELQNNLDTIRVGETIAVRRSNRYRGQLRVLMKDAPQLNNKFEKVRYDSKSLAEIAKDYHLQIDRNQPYTEYLTRETMIRAEVGLWIGAGIGRLEMSESLFTGYYGINRIDFGPASLFSAGILLSLHPNFAKKISLDLEPSYQSSKYESHVTYIDFNTVESRVRFELQAVNLPLSISYTFREHGKTTRPFVKAGLWRSYFLSKKSEMSYTITSPSGSKTSGSYNNYPLADLQNGYLLAAGVKTKIAARNFFITAKYENGNGVHKNADNPSVKYKRLSSTTCFTLQMGFTF
jgi:hypothetical protein